MDVQTDDDDFDPVRFKEQAAQLEAMEAASAVRVGPDAVDVREPQVTSGEEGTRSFVLYKRVKVDGVWLRRVSIRPPIAEDIDDWGTGRVKSSREMLARLTGLHPAVIRGLDSVDLEILYKMFWDMVPDWLRDTAAPQDA